MDDFEGFDDVVVCPVEVFGSLAELVGQRVFSVLFGDRREFLADFAMVGGEYFEGGEFHAGPHDGLVATVALAGCVRFEVAVLSGGFDPRRDCLLGHSVHFGQFGCDASESFSEGDAHIVVCEFPVELFGERVVLLQFAWRHFVRYSCISATGGTIHTVEPSK